MKHTLLKKNRPLLATLATVLFMPALTHAATVIDHVPYTITASGEYILMSNFTANATKAISVQAANVVINLNGFTLAQGQAKSGSDGIEVLADNVTVRNGTISGFDSGVIFRFSSQGAVQDLRLLRNTGAGVYFIDASGATVANCFIFGTESDDTGIYINSGDGILLQNNQISQCDFGVLSFSVKGCAIIHNYIANADSAWLELSDHDYYQGNVATNCKTAFHGGHAVGTENGGE